MKKILLVPFLWVGLMLIWASGPENLRAENHSSRKLVAERIGPFLEFKSAVPSKIREEIRHEDGGPTFLVFRQDQQIASIRLKYG